MPAPSTPQTIPDVTEDIETGSGSGLGRSRDNGIFDQMRANDAVYFCFGSRVCENVGRIRTEQFVLAHVKSFIDRVDGSHSFGSRLPLRCRSIRCIFHHMITRPMVTMLRRISSVQSTHLTRYP